MTEASKPRHEFDPGARQLCRACGLSAPAAAHVLVRRQGDEAVTTPRREAGCQFDRVSLRTPCCQYRTDIPVDDLRWAQERAGGAITLWCGRSWGSHQRRGGCDWLFRVRTEFSEPPEGEPMVPVRFIWTA